MHGLAVDSGCRVIESSDYLHRQHVKRGAIKRWLQRTQLIQHDAHRPNISGECVGLRLHDLRWEIIGCPHTSLSFSHRGSQYFGDTEVSDLDYAFSGHEYILALQIPVNYLTIVDMLHAETYLTEPVQNLCLWKVAPPLLLHFSSQVTT